MAEYWTDFHIAIPSLTEAQAGWMRSQFEHDPDEVHLLNRLAGDTPGYHGPPTALQDAMLNEGVDEHSLRWEFARRGDAWLLTLKSKNGNGETGILFRLLRTFSAAFPAMRPLRAEWGYWCSRSLPDAFGGGGAVFHAGRTWSIETADLLLAAIDRIEGEARRVANPAVDAAPCWQAHIIFTFADLEELTLPAGGTLRHAIEAEAEARARARLQTLLADCRPDQWAACYGPVEWRPDTAAITIGLRPTENAEDIVTDELEKLLQANTWQ